jgi:fermentation-respiration switch protein FrsA (DUF1100 family)
MTRQRITKASAVVLIVFLAAFGWLLAITRSEAHNLLTNRIDERDYPHMTPTVYGLEYEDVLVVSSGETELLGWYIPSQNGAAVIVQHGYKGERSYMLTQASILAEHGYGVLVSTVRAHDYSDGTEISFGIHEMDDLDAWYQYLITRPDIDPERIGILGNSYGGMLAIQYAAQNPRIKAVVTQSAFSSLQDTTATSVTFFTGLPSFPFAPLIVAWAEREGGFQAEQIDATTWIGQISPRPILLIQGGADRTISPESGRLLYEAAGEPKELWFEPELGHAGFEYARPVEYERRVIGFFDQYLGS